MANLLSTNVTGTINSTGNTTAAGFTGNANVGGTGTATWHPNGIYSGGTQWLYGTTYRNNATTSNQGQLYFDGNYGYGMVGLYSDVRYQAVFAMGDSYKLPVDGTGPGSLYGIAWTHSNIGGESKAGLGHQALFMMNGRTYTAIGSGIWTDGTITTTSHGTSANWKAAFDWGSHAGLYAAASHTHTIANVTGLQAALDGKQAAGSYAAASHTHTIANVTGLQAALDGKQAAGSYAAASHNHTIDEVDGLVDELAGKQASGSYLTTSGKAADSDLLDGLDLHTGRNNEANKIVRTQGNGYVDFGWINTTSGNTTGTISDVYVNTNDGYIRKATPAHFRSQITDGVYAPVSHTHTFASLTSKPTTISGYGITDAITTGNIGSQSVSSASRVSITGFGTDSFTYHQTAGNVHSWTGGWASHFIGNHGNGDTYYSQSIIMPFWSVPRYQRNEGGTKVGPWQFITEENIATQSVSFATTSGSATSATSANRLDNYGINQGSDWNTWGVYGKLVASSYHEASGANKPPTYAYGSFLSFLNSGADSFQIAIPENQFDGTGKARAMHFRSAWNGTWSSWRQVVDIQNNVCDILADGTSTLMVRQGVGYNQPFSSNIEIHGTVDDWAYGKFRFRVQNESGTEPVYGAQFRIERFSVNTGWQLLGMVPRASQNLEWQGEIFAGLSDQRVKENVVSLTDGVATVQQINPVEFDWKPVENVSEREGHDIGFIAQQLEEIVPTAVHTRSDGYKTVKYEKVVPILVQAIKEQQSLIEQLTARIEALENR